MNPVDNLIKTFGALTELWLIAYKGFLGQGLNSEEALKHTKEFMSITMNTMMNSGKEEQ